MILVSLGLVVVKDSILLRDVLLPFIRDKFRSCFFSKFIDLRFRVSELVLDCILVNLLHLHVVCVDIRVHNLVSFKVSFWLENEIFLSENSHNFWLTLNMIVD